MAIVTTPAIIANFSKLVDPAVRKHFFDTLKQDAPMIEKVMHVSSQEDYNEQHQNYAGLASLQLVGEGDTIPEDSFLQTYGTTYTPNKYSSLLSVSWELAKWEKVNAVTKAAQEQAKSANRKIEELAAYVFNNAQNTAATSYGDGKPLASTDHTRADGGTSQSNASATGILLTEANLETAQIAMEQILDDRGQSVSVFADTLLVPPALRKEGLIITKSDMRSGTSDNDINVYNGSMIEYKGANLDKVLVWKYLAAYLGGSDTAWALMDSANHKINWLWGAKPSVGDRDDSVGYKNDLTYWKVRFEASTGFDDFRGFWRSKGDGLAYSS